MCEHRNRAQLQLSNIQDTKTAIIETSAKEKSNHARKTHTPRPPNAIRNIGLPSSAYSSTAQSILCDNMLINLQIKKS